MTQGLFEPDQLVYGNAFNPQAGQRPDPGRAGPQLSKPIDEVPPEEEELVREALQSMQKIRYGSVVLVIHDGHLVEVSKTVRIRQSRAAGNGKEKNKR